MDTHSGHIDRDNAYTGSYTQPNSSLTNKSSNHLDYSSTGHHDYLTKDYTLTHHLDNLYSPQKTNDTFGTTNIYHNVGTSNLTGSQSPTHLSGIHKTTKPSDLATSTHFQTYTSTYQPLSHHHEERSLKSSRDDVKASLDSARKVRESALRLLSEGPSAAKESHVLQNTYGTGVSAYGTVSDTHGIPSTVHHHHDYPTHHVEETKLNYDVHGLSKESPLKKSNYVHDSTYEKLSPEAKRILGSSVLDNHNSSSHLSPERKHMMHHEASPNPYLSTLANTAQTTIDPIIHRDTHATSRLSDVTPAPFNRELLENINDYRMNDPVVSRRTIYTIENPAIATNKHTATQDNRNLRTPERVQKVRSPARSPLDDLRHSLNNNSAKISKIIIETVDEGEGTFQATEDTLGNNRLDIIMEQNVPLGTSSYRSPDRSARRANEQESTFREPSTLKTDYEHLKRDITALTGYGHNESHHNYRLGESSDAVRYQTRSDRSETEHHHHHAYERPSSSHKSPEKRPEPLVHESHHHHDDHHHHHHDDHHHHHHEEETKHESHAPKEEVKVHKEKKSSHLLVKGVIGLLVIILSSLLYLELFTDIKYENYLTF